MRRRGFTLIELLVVVAVIGTLISVMLPALGSARQSAYVSGDLSNLRQLALAIDLYAEEHDNYYNPIQSIRWTEPEYTPGGWQIPGTGGEIETTWRYHLYEYVDFQAEAYDSYGEPVAVYADGVTEEELQWAGQPASKADPNIKGIVSSYEQYNHSGMALNCVHYWEDSDATGPFGRPKEFGYIEGLTRRTEVQQTSRFILGGTGGSSSPQLWPEDNWWIYKWYGSSGTVGEAPYNRYNQFVINDGKTDIGAQRYHGSKGVYTLGDGSARTIEANVTLCTEQECWWSPKNDPHDDTDPPPGWGG